MNTKFKTVIKYLRIVFYIAILATLVFIFVNSALPPDKSGEQSDRVSEIISGIIPPDTDVGNFVITNIRKIAHFTEYGLLGVLVSLYVLIYTKNRVAWGFGSLMFALLVAFTDESIQIMSGRGPSIIDIWIDIGGFTTYALLTYGSAVAIYYLVRLAMYIVKRTGRKNTNENTN